MICKGEQVGTEEPDGPGEAGWLTGVVTTGQSFGGDLETVTVHTGLLAARHVLGADVEAVLADLGADVIKLENPDGGDPFRAFKGGLYSPHCQTYNRNKRSLCLDLKSPQAAEVVERREDGRLIGKCGIIRGRDGPIEGKPEIISEGIALLSSEDCSGLDYEHSPLDWVEHKQALALGLQALGELNARNVSTHVAALLSSPDADVRGALDDGDAEERHDPAEAVQPRQVEQEQFQHDHGEQQRPEPRAAPFRIGPADHHEFLAVQAFHFEPQAAVTRGVGRIRGHYTKVL